MYAGPIQRLVTELARLPGIGQRTAQRLAFHILRAEDEEAFGLAEAIREVKEKVGLCEVCFHIAELLRGKVTITRLASGLPVGADLEHADEVTLGRALSGRLSLDR